MFRGVCRLPEFSRILLNFPRWHSVNKDAALRSKEPVTRELLPSGFRGQAPRVSGGTTVHVRYAGAASVFMEGADARLSPLPGRERAAAQRYYETSIYRDDR